MRAVGDAGPYKATVFGLFSAGRHSRSRAAFVKIWLVFCAGGEFQEGTAVQSPLLRALSSKAFCAYRKPWPPEGYGRFPKRAINVRSCAAFVCKSMTSHASAPSSVTASTCTFPGGKVISPLAKGLSGSPTGD